jgi:O-acetyl-ADP-ribose deacetylase (regulator of RNase III)
MISYAPHADISTDQAQLLVNTVNTVGVMGAGVAKAVRLRYPDIMGPYKAACESTDPRRRLEPGTLHLYNAPDGRLLVNMATKQNWRDPSEYDWVGAGLVYLNRLLCERRTDIRSVLLPPPGCGNGGLDWPRVNRMVQTYLRPAAERGVEIRISAPQPDPVSGPIRFAGVGSRETLAPVLALMREVGSRLAGTGWCLRTGEAVGADSAFRAGVEATGRAGDIFTIKPRPDIPGSVCDLRPVHLRMLNSVHPKPDALSPVGRKLMARNGSQVFGTDFTEPSDLVICWTVGGKGGGGTGQAIRLARSVGIPVLDLGLPEHEGVRAGDIVARARDLVEGHRTACGVPMTDGQSEPDALSGP